MWWENFGSSICWTLYRNGQCYYKSKQYSNNNYGVTCWNSDAIISNNTFDYNEVASVFSTVWSNGSIENNRILRSGTYGIRVNGWSNSNPQPANPDIIGNYIFDSGRGGPAANGMEITIYSTPLIKDNIIINSTEDGIYFGQWCESTVINTTINGANYGIASSSARNVTIINCTVLNVGPNYDLSIGSATYFTTINTTFDKSNVGFLNTNGNLTVKWYMHVCVEDADFGTPINNADVRVRDNSNGTYDDNFTTGTDGYKRWVVVPEYYQTDNNGDSDGDDPGEKILYTPYDVDASATGYIDNTNQTDMGESKVVLVELSSVPEFSTILLPVLFILLINIGRKFYSSGR